MEFSVANEVLDLKLNLAIITIEGMKNEKSNSDFANYKKNIIKEVKETLTEDSVTNSPILNGFWDLHAKVGKTSKKDMSSPENLLNMLLQYGDIPNINLIVDIYNLVSIKTQLALGAHDLDKIDGNVCLRLTNGDEYFLPIGYSKPKPTSKGEYAYIDDNNEILCRMEVRQVEKTKVEETTKSCMYIIQGNENVDNNLIDKAVNELIELTTKYCDGVATVIYKSF